MEKSKRKNTKPVTGNTDKNAGSGSFNQGTKQDNGASKIIAVSDQEKRTGHRPPTSGKKKGNSLRDSIMQGARLSRIWHVFFR